MFWRALLKKYLAVFSLLFLVNIGQSTDDGEMEEHIWANLVYHLLNKNIILLFDMT